MGKIKLKIFTIAFVTLVMTFLMQETLAFYSTVGTASNVITSGNIEMKIHEKTADGNDFPTEGVYIIPGDIVSKEVSIENICEHPFYLRVKIIYGINSEQLTADDCFKLNIDETNWRLVDGWYYYTGVLMPGDTTPNVFSHVEIVGSKVDKNYIGKTLSLTVQVHAVQSENNPVEDGQTHTAFGWPNEE